MKKVVLLGCGFVGKYLNDFLKKENYDIILTSRNPEVNLSEFSNTIKFDLSDPLTYQNIPENSEIIFLFPAEPFELVQNFYNYIHTKSHIRIVLGTTSIYTDKTGIINESSSIDADNKRFHGESFLMKKGSIILSLSGIYGGTRHPFDWLNKGLIKNANKTVNLIHVNDICHIILKFLQSDVNSERFNISDGSIYWWRELWKIGKDRNLIKSECPPELEKESRIINNQKLLNFIGNNYSFQKI